MPTARPRPVLTAFCRCAAAVLVALAGASSHGIVARLPAYALSRYPTWSRFGPPGPPAGWSFFLLAALPLLSPLFSYCAPPPPMPSADFVLLLYPPYLWRCRCCHPGRAASG
ncbi:unnamed protein product [Pleuronectes platessa]|uniref:Uncharacterized protein n=1 Tax=Pleuronectes platessa TaxID=8262 RepID=A0A9N7Z462_PLEPL|nr:unnamed protein product [Pleuronectes platessa]